MTKASILTCIGAVLLAVVTPGLVRADSAPCSGNTTGDTWDCSGSCSQGQKVGLHMYSNDANSEHGFANTSCSTATAACSFISPTGQCDAESSGTAGGSSTWACHFEAHDDDWWGWDDGFSYNCYAFTPSGGGGGGGGGNPGVPGGGKVGVTVQTGTTTGTKPSSTSAPPSPPSASPSASVGCGGVPSGDLASKPLLAILCAKLADPEQASRLVVSYAEAQTIVFASGGEAAGITCSGNVCHVIAPTCVPLADGYACDVTPSSVT